MFARRQHKTQNIVVIHGNNNLSPKEALCCHINVRLLLSWSIDCLVNIIDFFANRLEKFSLIFKTLLMLANET